MLLLNMGFKAVIFDASGVTLSFEKIPYVVDLFKERKFCFFTLYLPGFFARALKLFFNVFRGFLQ